MIKKYVIEHMEPEDELSPWVYAEYKHMTKLLSQGASQLVFTRVSELLLKSFPQCLIDNRNGAMILTLSTDEWLQNDDNDTNVSIDKICLLDPASPTPLKPSDGEQFTHFLFGGILGDDPPRDRTSELREKGYETRNLGHVQMTTDTAVGVTKKVVEDQINLESIPYVDYPTIRLDQHESVEMPFRYIRRENGEPLMPDGMRELLKEDMDKTFV